ncbi:hypothetical protein Peur_066434 [Populus x canadensis]
MSSIINSKRKVRVCTPHKPLLLSLPDCSSIDVAVAARHLLPPTRNIPGFTVLPNLPDPPLVRLPPLPPIIPSVPSPPSSIPSVSFPTTAAAIHNGP